MEIRIDPEFEVLIPPLSDEERIGLEADIIAAGRAEVALRTWNGTLLDGHNRYEICTRNNLPFTTEEVSGLLDRYDAKLWIIRHQFNRRNLPPFSRIELALVMEEVLSERGRQRQSEAGGDKKSENAKNGFFKIEKSDKEQSRDDTTAKETSNDNYVDSDASATPHNTWGEVAKTAGVSVGTLHTAKTIIKQASPEVKDKLRKGQTTIHAEAKAIKEAERKQAVAAKAAEVAAKAATHPAVFNNTDTIVGCTLDDLKTVASSGRKFGCLYADPPWKYDNQSTRGSTENHYDGMSVDEICALPIHDLMADDAHLHLWITNAFLFDAPKIFDAWGFEFKSSYIWVKPQMGMGNYWRNSHEILLTAVRGDAKRFNDHGMMSWGEFSRGKHSAKPEEIRAMIERASPGPYIELFGRRQVEGWSVWGNEASADAFLAAA